MLTNPLGSWFDFNACDPWKLLHYSDCYRVTLPSPGRWPFPHSVFPVRGHGCRLTLGIPRRNDCHCRLPLLDFHESVDIEQRPLVPFYFHFFFALKNFRQSFLPPHFLFLPPSFFFFIRPSFLNPPQPRLLRTITIHHHYVVHNQHNLSTFKYLQRLPLEIHHVHLIRYTEAIISEHRFVVSREIEV